MTTPPPPAPGDAPAPHRPASGIRALLWSLVIPGLGEWRLGHRRTGAALGLATIAALLFFLEGAWVELSAISVTVRAADPALQVPPTDPSQVGALWLRMILGMLSEYRVQRPRILAKLAVPFWSIAAIYIFSMGYAYWLGERARRSAGTSG